MAQGSKSKSQGTSRSSNGQSSNGESSNGQNSGGLGSSVLDAVTKNPAAERLLGEVETFLRDRALDLVDSIGDRITDATEKLDGIAANGGVMKKAAKSMGDGDSPLKAGVKALGGSVKDKVGDLLGGGGSNGSGPVKSTLIEESIDIGVPVSVAYNQWTQFQEFGRFTKGVQSVDQQDDTTTNWKAKVAFSTRSWQANITEQVPDERIAWTADGDKGSVAGVVTFHELAPNLTRVLLELEYHPKGVLERTGNLWRAQGRRARLDLKHFRAFVMMRGEETGAWRGEIRDGDVTRSSGKGSRRENGDGGEGRRRHRSTRDRSPARSKRGSQERRSERPPRRRTGDGVAESHGETEATKPRRSSSSSAGRRSRQGAARRPRSRAARPSSDRSSEDTSTSSDDTPSAQESSDARGKKSTAGKKTTSRAKSARKRTPRKRTPRKLTAAKRTGDARKTSGAARKTTARKSTAAGKKPAARKSTTGAKKTTPANKATPRKRTSGRKKTAPARKTTPRKTSAGRKATTRKSTPRKSTPRKAAGVARSRSSRARKSTAGK